MDHIKPEKSRPFACGESKSRDARFSSRPLYPVPIFRDTKVDRIAEVARFGGYLFVKTERGWALDLFHQAD